MQQFLTLRPATLPLGNIHPTGLCCAPAFESWLRNSIQDWINDRTDVDQIWTFGRSIGFAQKLREQ